MDILYLGVAVAFFILTWGLLTLCERLDNQQSGGKQ